MTGRALGKITPGLRRPTWEDVYRPLIGSVLDSHEQVMNALVPGYKMICDAVRDLEADIALSFRSFDRDKHGVRWRDLYGQPRTFESGDVVYPYAMFGGRGPKMPPYRSVYA